MDTTRNGKRMPGIACDLHDAFVTPTLYERDGTADQAHLIAADLYNATLLRAALADWRPEDFLDAAEYFEDGNLHRTAGAYYAAAGYYRLDHNKKYLEEIMGTTEYPTHRKR